MSYLEMAKAPVANMTKGIISLWFRDISAGPDAPATPASPGAGGGGNKPIGWPLPVPPNTFEVVKTSMPPGIFFWNAYGLPQVAQLGTPSPFLGPPPVWSPIPPPIPTDNIHMLMTFGDPGQVYDYAPWEVEDVSVIQAVRYFATGFIHLVEDFPPPYAPYLKVYNGEPVGTDGLLSVKNMTLGSPVAKRNIVPQSFIGVDEAGYIKICLQTSTKADYKGYAFALDLVEPIWAEYTVLKGVPPSHWEHVGGYWNGYQFTYKDVSNKIMGAQGEAFVIGGPGAFLQFSNGPKIERDGKGTWHHLLFSFDISGAVDSVLNSDDGHRTFTTTTSCKAWLALDDVAYKGAQLQERFAVPDGFLAPTLPGVPTSITNFGPCTCASRAAFNIGPNDILPRTLWTLGFNGLPREGLMRAYCTSGIATADRTYPNAPPVLTGDYNPISWAGALWPLFWHLGDWMPNLTPPHSPSNPDPATDLDPPTYHCSSFEIPTADHPIGIPVTIRHLDHNTGVEMGEMQMWIGKTLDANTKSNRRLFIDDDGLPVSPKYAAEVLGQPDIMLHGSSNWKAGRNTGKSGITADDKIIPAGQFKPVAGIEKFKPDPALGQ